MIPKIKKQVFEPSVYAMTVRYSGGEILYVGVHYSMDQAYHAARERLTELHNPDPRESVEIDLWTAIQGSKVIADLLDPSSVSVEAVNNMLEQIVTHEQEIIKPTTKKKIPHTSGSSKIIIEKPKNTKDELIKKLIDNGNRAAIEKLGDVLTENEKTFIIDQIKNNAKK